MFKSVPGCIEGIPGHYGMFGGIMGCSRGVPGLFRAVPVVFRGVPGVFRGVPGCSGVFRGVPGCSGVFLVCSGFYRHPSLRDINPRAFLWWAGRRDLKNIFSVGFRRGSTVNELWLD